MTPIPKDYGVTVQATVFVVNTMKGAQHQRGFYGVVLHKVPGERLERTKCGHFHQKAGAARACATRTARVLAREEQSNDDA